MAKKKATFRSTSRRLALEPRLLFDGAAAIAGADALDNHNQQEGQKDNAAHATPPAGESHAGRNTPAATTSFDFVDASDKRDRPLLDLAHNTHAFEPLLTEAAHLAQDKLQTWVNSADFEAQAAQIFSADAGSAEWSAQLDALRTDILDGSYSIRTEVRSNAELMQVLGAYSTTGTTGERVIYLNAEWLAKSDAATVATVLLEELGHDIDDRLNSGKDSAGDEGHAFASLLLTGDANMAVNLGRDDQRTLVLDGMQVQVENAGAYAIQQIHFVAMPENQINSGIKNIYSGGSGSKTVIETVIAIAATSNRTVIVYDHWEDGYESNINNPTQTGITKEWTYTDADGWFIDTNGDFIKG